MSDSKENENHVETAFSDMEKAMEMKDELKIETDYAVRPLIYSVCEDPPIHVTIVCAFQV